MNIEELLTRMNKLEQAFAELKEEIEERVYAAESAPDLDELFSVPGGGDYRIGIDQALHMAVEGEIQISTLNDRLSDLIERVDSLEEDIYGGKD
jgi:chaperonin cofactor prefoldin